MNAPGDIYIIQEQYVFQPFNQLRNICNSNVSIKYGIFSVAEIKKVSTQYDINSSLEESIYRSG